MTTHTPVRTASRTHLRSASRAMALEPRLLFDGAGAVAAADNVDMADDHHAEAQQQETPPAADVPLLDLADSAAGYQSLLADAAGLAQQKLVDWVSSDAFRQQAAEIFSADAGSAEWNAQLDALRGEILNGSYSIRTEVRSNAELMQVLGAYSTTGTTGERTLYLNAEWLAKSDAAAVAAVLLEEIGHDIDDRVNSGKDSAGDEGHAFASLLLTGDANMAVNLGRDDHRTLVLDGVQVQVENAGPYSIAQIHYVPMPENQILDGMKNIYTTSSQSSIIDSIIAITATSNKTIVVYDHWEDIYESNINSPSQDTTQVWTYTDDDGWFVDTDGDGIRNNGEALVANGTTIVASGRTLILRNNVPTAHATAPGSNIYFDGRDKIGSTKAVTITRAGYDTGITSIVGGAVNLIDASNAGSAFVIPIGTDTGGSGLFLKTSLFIMAYADGTEVTITLDDGVTTITRTLSQGESLYVAGKSSGGVEGATSGNAAAVINDGTTVTANKAIGVNILAGKANASENRWFSIAPTEAWGSSYYAPVASVGNAATDRSDVYLYNNNNEAITVKYDTLNTSGNIVSQSVSVAANSRAIVEMPKSAAHFYTEDGKRFYAVASVDRGTSRDWSYTLVAEKTLTDRFVVAWGPGNGAADPASGSNKNGSPVWVTSTEDTWLYVDSATVDLYSAAGANSSNQDTPQGTKLVKDATLSTAEVSVYRISKLQSYRIFDTSDNNQTGLTVYTMDGTLLTAAWGIDATVAGTGSPYLDMGFTVSPQPDYLIQKTAVEAATSIHGEDVSNDNGLIELGEQVEYTITISNRAVIDLFNVNIKDQMSNATSGTYVTNSASLQVLDENNNVLLDIADFDGDTDIFPLLGDGYTLIDMNSGVEGDQGLAIGSRIVVTYRVTIRGDIDSVLQDDNYSVSNSVTMSGQPPVGDPIDPKTVTVNTKLSTIVADAQSVAEDSTISKTFKVTNTEGLSKIVIGGTDVSLAQLQAATSGSPVVINTTEGALKITGYTTNPVTKIGTVTYTYDPAGTGKIHNAANDPVQDTVTLVAHIGAGTVSTNLVIAITDTAPTANDDARTLAYDTMAALPGNVYASGGTGDVADLPGGDTTTLTHIGAGPGAPTAAVAPGSTSADEGGGTSVTGTYGTLVIGADGSYTYDLDEAMNAVATLPLGGTLLETFSYRITDSEGDESTALLTISIRNAGVAVSNVTVNETAPHAVFEVNFTDKITLALIDGTATGGTTSPDDGSVDYHTTMEYSEDGSTWQTYTPASQIAPPPSGKIFVRVPIVTDSSPEGSETFQLKVTDENSKTATGTGTIVDNQPPVANNDTRSTPEDTPVSGNVITGAGTGDVADTDPDGNPLTVTGFTVGGSSYAPGSAASIPGVGSITLNADGSYTFTPVADWHGTVPPIAYTVSDGSGGTDTATLAITVTPVADIADDTTTTPAGNPVTTPVLNNDSFEGSPVVTVGPGDGPAHGTVTVNPDGSITYRPDPGFSGDDRYVYTVTSGGVSETATVTVKVIPENPPPPAMPVTDPGDTLPIDQPTVVGGSPSITLNSPVILDAGPFFASERANDVRRMDLPFHPIVYVNREVVVAQELRTLDDQRASGDPALVDQDLPGPQSLGMSLGQDWNLFVTHAIRESQQTSGFVRNSVDGRYARIDLSSDGYLPRPGLNDDTAIAFSDIWKDGKPSANDAEAPVPQATQATDSVDKTADAADEVNADLPARKVGAGGTAPQPRAHGGAPSFGEQLRRGAARLPLAPRAA